MYDFVETAGGGKKEVRYAIFHIR